RSSRLNGHGTFQVLMPVNVSPSTRNWLTREGSTSGYSQPIDSSGVPGTPKAAPAEPPRARRRPGDGAVSGVTVDTDRPRRCDTQRLVNYRESRTRSTGDIHLRAGCSFLALRMASFFSFFTERAAAVACAIRDPTSYATILAVAPSTRLMGPA